MTFVGVTPICKVHDIEWVWTRLACVAFAHGPGLSTVANCVHELISAKMIPQAHVCQSAINTQPHPCFLTMKFRHVYLRFESSHETRSLLSFRSWKPQKDIREFQPIWHLADCPVQFAPRTSQQPFDRFMPRQHGTGRFTVLESNVVTHKCKLIDRLMWRMLTSPGSVLLCSAFSRSLVDSHFSLVMTTIPPGGTAHRTQNEL